MNEIQYKRWLHKIDILMKRKEKIKTYNLSGSGWQDYYTANERDRLYRRNERAEQKKREIDQMLLDILQMLKQEGYDTDKLMEKYNHRNIDNDGR